MITVLHGVEYELADRRTFRRIVIARAELGEESLLLAAVREASMAALVAGAFQIELRQGDPNGPHPWFEISAQYRRCEA